MTDETHVSIRYVDVENDHVSDLRIQQWERVVCVESGTRFSPTRVWIADDLKHIARYVELAS